MGASGQHSGPPALRSIAKLFTEFCEHNHQGGEAGQHRNGDDAEQQVVVSSKGPHICPLMQGSSDARRPAVRLPTASLTKVNNRSVKSGVGKCTNNMVNH